MGANRISKAFVLYTHHSKMALDPHVLPPDLERLVVETAAELYSEAIPNLLLVSRRVHEWWGHLPTVPAHKVN
jgi:hypothetical protein